MTQDHLQLHGQSPDNHNEAKDSSRIGGGDEGCWLGLKKIIAQENDQSEDLSGQLVK